MSRCRSILRDLRVAAGLTLHDAGRRCGWSAATLCRVETGKRTATPDEIAELIAIYIVT